MDLRKLMAGVLILCSGCGLAIQTHENQDISGNGSIINGTPVEERVSDAAKSVVLIEMHDIQGRPLTICTATLIGPNTVLTAAHCFDKTRMRAFGGFNVIFTNNYLKTYGNALKLKGLRMALHGSYNSTKMYDHDIALGTFKGEVPEGYEPVDYDSDKAANYAHQTVYSYGFGKSQDYTGKRGERGHEYVGVLHRGVLKVAGNYNSYSDRYFLDPSTSVFICSGDSGGPQFFHEDGVLKVIGVHSAVYGTKLDNGFTSCKGRGQVTKVAPFAQWIRETESKLLTN
ncbi:S1 family peptidase [Bdellovibrio reynosensis]|uniref:S1 family peptidase n=1 Tax=Bdellovibrio reynosensis TaxID=2835041 RepID=A0ABY4CDJ4_9BACT|nr:S1 family peptidase [Bdellovibrio reynosensis]UOF02799.1 S1 family peptidase [Bdellovibrio reynosensis]